MTTAAYPTMYAQDDDHGGCTLRRAKTGWVLNAWSYCQGARTGYRLLLPYAAAPYGYNRETALNAPHNEMLAVAEALVWLMQDDLLKDGERRQTRTLLRGWEVA